MSQINFADQHQYLLIISPPTVVTQKVMGLKQDYNERFKFGISVKSKPHITLLWEKLNEQDQDAFVNAIKVLISGIYAFRIKLKGIDGFPTHTIYVRVMKEGLAYKQFLERFRTSRFRESLKPHLTIARDLDEETYRRAMKYYDKKEFEETFTVNSFTLLKRKDGKEPYKLLHEFPLSEAPSLFS